MPIEISTIFDSQFAINRLIDQFMVIEERPRNVLLDRKEDLEDRKSVLSDLDSKLSALKAKTDRMTDPITDYFAGKLATTSDSDLFTATAGASAVLGNHSLSVERLAVSDTRVSKQYTDTNSSFSAFTQDQTFQIEVAHPLSGDSSNRVSVGVTVTSSTFSQTDDQVLSDIADAINTAMANAVTAETIESDEVVHASVVTEASGQSRLVLRSERSGYTYRVDFTDSTDSLLAALEVNSASQSSGTSGGYMTAIGTGPTDSQLNAKFTLDGLTFYRDSNNVTDAVTGVTLQLLDTFTTTETLTITADTDSVKQEVQDFLDAYNEAIKFLRVETRYDPDSGERGPLTDDLVYKDIINSLRNYTVSEVTGAASSTYIRLFNIGIEADDEGLLSIEDTEKFTEAVEANSTYVSDLFNASDGVATQIKDYIDTFVKVGGTIDSSKNNIDDQITNLDDRIAFVDELLQTKEAQLRDEFARLQEAMALLANQQSFFGTFSQQ